MSWVVSHRIEWTDILALDWKIEIEKDSYSGSIASMQADGVPLKIDFLTNGDNLLENPIKGSTAEFTTYSDTSFQWVDIYSSFDLERRVSIYHSDTTLFWRGFITPGNYSEPYDGVSYAVNISASDCLGFLKNIYFTADGKSDGTPFTGRRLTSQIILDILWKIQVTSFTEFVNMYEDGMLQTIDDSPMDQEQLNADLFIGMNCYDVLEIILKKYNAIIRQEAGVYIIYRPYELVSLTLYGRVFTAATTKTSTTRAPIKHINRTTNESDIHDVEGGMMMIQQQTSKVIIKQDYGNKESWINNWNFTGNTLTQVGLLNYSVTGWSKANNCLLLPITKAIPSETDGVLITSQNAYPSINTYIYQSFGVNIVDTTDTCYFEFDYLLYNFSTTDRTGEEFYVLLMSNNASKYLYGVNEDVAGWSDTTAKFEITADAPVGTTGWTTYKNKVPGIPTAGSYTIALYAINNVYPQVYIGFKNIRFYSTSENITLKFTPEPKKKGEIFYWGKRAMRPSLYFENNNIIQKVYTHDNGVIGVPIEINAALGDVTDSNLDNVIEQFQGSSGKYISSVLSPSASWGRRGFDESLPSLQIICDEIAWQYHRPKQLINLPIMEADLESNIPHIDLLGRYEDDLNKVDDVNREFVFSRGSFNVRDREWDIDICEIIPPAATYSPPPTTYGDYGAFYNWYAVSYDGESSSFVSKLLAYWTLDQNNTLQNDEIGSNHLTVTGATYYSTDAKIGYSVDFTATTNRLAKSSASLVLGNAFSLFAWFKLDNMPSTGYTSIIELVNDSESIPVANIRIYSGGQVECNVKNTAHANFDAYTNDGSVIAGVWYFVVFVNYGNGMNPKVFLNNTDATAGYTTFTGTVNTGCDLIIVGNTIALDAAIDGSMDDLGIEDGAMTSDEMTLLYNDGYGKAFSTL